MPGLGTPVVNPPVSVGPLRLVPPLVRDQAVFADDLAAKSGLDLGVVVAWCLAEESSSAAIARQNQGNNNWLNIGYFDSGAGTIAFNIVFQQPDTGAHATWRFLKGTFGGASPGIQGILGSVGSSPAVQIRTIQNSGWATSHYPSLPAIYASLSAKIRGGSPSGVAAGLGGTGTLTNDTANFRVGDPTNPDEDYWTAMNRLAMERYWYSGSLSLILPTPDGWTTLGELEVGDEVFGTSGRPIRVTRLFPIYEDRECFRVVFRDGTSVVTDAEHRWTTSRGTISTEQIAASVTTTRSGSKSVCYNHKIHAATPLDLSPVDLPLDPYLLGYWLGDGTSTQPRITVHNEDREHLLVAVAAAGFPSVIYAHSSPGSSQVVFRSGCIGRGHLSPLKRLGVLGQKHIPSVYLRASYDQRLALLQGLMDSDGWICNKSCTFSNVNERLADDVLELIRTLGLQPHRSVRKYRRPVRNPQGEYSVARDQVTVKFGMPEFCPFRLPRKAERYRLACSRLGPRRKRYHTIVAVEPVPSEPVRCIEVDSPDHLFLVGEAMVPTHNCFSDGETLYVADGPDLMKQTPALEVDRVANAPNISHLDLTYDNTAFQFTATHKKRKHTQRRTALAKVTSPVEAQMNYICAIDEVRAGDVVKLDNCGPGDGAWLAGDVRRSVFEVSSEINLVVALTPLTEAALQPAGINPLNPSSSTPIVVNAPAKVRKMVALAQSLVGAPYSQANHAASFSQTVDQVRRLGTDCSGFVSILLGPKGAGILSSPQTTQTLSGAPGIASGPGKYVTLHDRNTGSVNNEHVIIEMSGYWFESGGNTTFNPHGGVSQMTAAQAAGELRGGGFVPLHPRGM